MKQINLCYLVVLLMLVSCENKKLNFSSPVRFDVGFENIKSHQGVYINAQNGKEEVFFVKTEFNPHIKFFDLSGNLLDSLFLNQVEKQLGRIGRVSLTSRDSIVIVSYAEQRVAAIKGDGNYWFNWSLDSLAAYQEDEFAYLAAVAPCPIMVGNDIIFLSYWEGNRLDNQNGIMEKMDSYYEFYSYFYSHFIKAPILCKVENVFSETPSILFGLESYFYDLSPLLKSYYTGARYFIANNKVFFFILFDRYLYEVDNETMEVINKICVVTEEYEIPQSIELTEENSLIDTTSEEKEELREKCYMTNMLYDKRNKEYYVFVKTGRDNSYVDEFGYPFKIVIFDENFVKLREVDFDTDEYAPQSAMMTSKGIMIEQIKKGDEYGKRTFKFLEI